MIHYSFIVCDLWDSEMGF